MRSSSAESAVLSREPSFGTSRDMSLEVSLGGKAQRSQRKEVRQFRYVYRR
ncbi:MAG: hypothetical protein ACI9W2_000293 [Gammaproteobacteria bacterium]|jgi:hypothetical protein